MLHKIRVILASIFFLLITLVLLDFTGAMHGWLGWLTKIQFLPAVLAVNVGVIATLVILTLVFGRIYCSVICPLGVFQDLLSWIHGRKKKNRFTYSEGKDWLRYAMLIVFVVALVAGVGSVVALLAPYGTYGRLVNGLLQPLYEWGNNGLAAISYHYDSYLFYPTHVWVKSVSVLAATVLTVAIIAYLSWKYGRTWCNTICPVGTVLGFLARFSWLKIYFDEDKCKRCGMCNKNCKASCIDFSRYKVDYSRCVTCGVCLDHCHFDALHYGHAGKTGQNPTRSSNESGNATRRAILAGVTVMGADAALARVKKKVDGGLAVIGKKRAPGRQTPVAPPGSMSVANMTQRCVGCQLCVSSCPNDVLRPSGGLVNFMQPVMGFENGFCRPECTRCSQVCPSGAIQPITPVEKSSIQVGHAVWRKKYCVVLSDHVSCGNCARHCPAGAIQMVPMNAADETSPMIPVVNEARCTGCGACEYVCPARPDAAIYIEGHEVHRII